MMRWFPLWVVDKILVTLVEIILGNTDKYGVKRPEMGPLELKNLEGKTPVLDIRTLGKIRLGQMQVVPGIKRFSHARLELVNGEALEIDFVVLATGYRNNMPSLLKECQEGEFFSKNRFSKAPFPNEWKGKAGLYAVRFTRRGLSGAPEDAIRVDEDISKIWKEETEKTKNPKAPFFFELVNIYKMGVTKLQKHGDHTKGIVEKYNGLDYAKVSPKNSSLKTIYRHYHPLHPIL